MIEKYLIGTYTRRVSKGVYQIELDTDAQKLQNLQLVGEALTQPTLRNQIKSESTPLPR